MNHKRYPTHPVTPYLSAFLRSLSPAQREKLGALTGVPQAYISRAILGESVPSAIGWQVEVFVTKLHLLSR
jgi:hypothetical protein